MKRFIFVVMGLVLMLAAACRKDKAVQPASTVRGPLMTSADTSGNGVSGPKDPTKPPPH